MTRSPADLMRVNLLEVFNEPDPDRRAAVIAENYAEDVVWHEPDRIIHGRTELVRRAAELRAENPEGGGPRLVLDVPARSDNAARCRAGRRDPVNLSGHSTR
ncbi:nuclear transport factor 2 family protein [Streptomyces goshikiensis]|uniref:nuclear transport factor 2 family protein n=1 Tax=Streptomyces goshikiensis TaxID=1942 RepID=UPI0036B26855